MFRNPVLPLLLYGSLALTLLGSALLAHRHRRAYRVGIGTVSVLWVLAGALVNLLTLLSGENYTGFADAGIAPFVRTTWESLVVPNAGLFIGLLIAFEAAAGLAVLVPGRLRRAGLWALIAFNVLLLWFGWYYLPWTLIGTTALALLLHADRRWGGTGAQRGARNAVSASAYIT